MNTLTAPHGSYAKVIAYLSYTPLHDQRYSQFLPYDFNVLIWIAIPFT